MDLQVVQTAVVFTGDEVPREPIPDDLRKAARASMLHCQSLVDNVMDFTKFKAGKMELESVEFSLRAVCEEVVQTTQYAFPSVPQTLSCAHCYRVKGSRRHLKQVLQNLTSNACKNTGPSGFVELEVELLAHTKPGWSAYWFAVRDTGCGVSREMQAQIFRKFEQVEVKPVAVVFCRTPTTIAQRKSALLLHTAAAWNLIAAQLLRDSPHDRQGISLGLPLVKGFVDLMGGHLRVDSPWHSDGRAGAQFHFKLVLSDGDCMGLASRASPPTRPAGGSAPGTRPGPLPKRWRVLLADDCRVARISFKFFLRQVEIGWVVDEAATGEEAVEMAAADGGKKYDLIILDEFFGQGLMRGTEATSVMRKLGVTAPIVGLTNADTLVPAHRERALAVGQDHVLGKPFTSVDKFRHILRRVLEEKTSAKSAPPTEGEKGDRGNKHMLGLR